MGCSRSETWGFVLLLPLHSLVVDPEHQGSYTHIHLHLQLLQHQPSNVKVDVFVGFAQVAVHVANATLANAAKVLENSSVINL